MMSRRRWLGSWGVMAVTYLGLGIPRLVTGDMHSAMVFLAMAAATLAFAAATLPIMAPRRRGSGPSGPGSDGEPPPDESPPWWPEFEREYWQRVRSGESAPWSRSPVGSPGRTRERTLA